MDIHELVCLVKKLAIELARTPTQEEFEDSGISKRKIDKFGYNKILKKAGLDQNKQTTPQEIEVRPPRVLFIDIETSAIKAYTYGLFDQNIGTEQIIEDWYLYSIAAKYLGSNEIIYLDQRNEKKISNDKKLTIFIHDLFVNSDVLIAHNLKKFDLKKINTRFIKHDLPPVNHHILIDTLQIARKFFSITSNKLAYLAKFLDCPVEKYDHSKFPGFTLWLEMEKKNQEAFKECEIYNKRDVDVLEWIYHKLVKYDPSIKFNSFEQKAVCTCGSIKFYKDGLRYGNNWVKQIYRCNGCGKSYTGKENLISKEIRKTIQF